MKRHINMLVILASLLVGIAYADEHDYEITLDGVWPEPTPYPEPTCNPVICPALVYPPDEPIYDVTVDPTEVPTTEPTVEPTVAPTEPTWEPTVTPTEIPTEIPTEVPTIEPTVEPTVEPTPEPTAEPTQVPTPAALVPNVANFTCSPRVVHIGEPIACVDTTLNASYAWQWHWSDGSNRSYGKSVNHTYVVPGIYDVWHSAHSKSPFASGALWKFNYITVRPTPLMEVSMMRYLGDQVEAMQTISISQKPKYLIVVAEDETVLGRLEFAPDVDNYTTLMEYNETEVQV
jgi:hypothetical protein